jgi:hypothetical protein
MAFVTADVDRDPGTLMASAVAGDDEAFSRIVATHHEDMRPVCAGVSPGSGGESSISLGPARAGSYCPPARPRYLEPQRADHCEQRRDGEPWPGPKR